MAAGPKQHERIIRSYLDANAGDLKNLTNEIHELVQTAASESAAELSETVGGLTGQIDLQLERAKVELDKPTKRMTDQLTTAIIDATRDLERAGYTPQLYQVEVQDDLTNPDGLEVFVRRMAATAEPVPELIPNADVCVTNPSYPGCTFNPTQPAPTNGTTTPVLAPTAPNCFPAGALDPSDPTRLICTSGGIGTPGVLESEPETSIPIPGLQDPVCPAPEPPQVLCPAPVIIMPPAGRLESEFNPATDEREYPEECEPCPEVEPPIVNVNVAVPKQQFPEPKEQPKFEFRALAPDVNTPGRPNLDTDAGCEQLLESCDKWNSIVNAAGGAVQDVADFLSVPFGRWVSNKLGFATTVTGPIVNLAMSVFADVDDDSEDAFKARVTAAQFSQVRLLQTMVSNNFGPAAACAMAPAAAAAAAVGIADELPFDFRYFVQPLEYERNYIFPVYLPTQPEIDALWLGDRITPEQHECYTRSLGNLPNLHRIAAEEKRERPNAREWIQIFMRGEIDSDRLFREMRKLGWLDQSEAARLLSLSAAIPTFGDVIRFMVRDTDNPQAVETGQLDSGFAESFVGQLKQWATANGVTEELAKRYWRAHWQWPSNTQLYEMIHRLRPGEVPDALAVTQDDAKKVLQINDVAPAFVDRLIAVSYSPLTRVDVRRAYEIGVLSEADVLKAYLDLGYSKENAATLTRFTVEQKNQKDARAVKVWSLAAVATAYEAGTIDPAFAFSRARLLLPSDAAVEQYLYDVDVKRQAGIKKRCLASARKRYMAGELNYLQGQDVVQNIIGDRARAVDIVNGWDCERAGKVKEIAAGTLCKWLGQGLIDMPAFLNRLSNLGYSEIDAQRMVASCSQDIFERERKAALAAARRNLSEYQKRLKEVQDAIKAREKKLKDLQTEEERCLALAGRQ